MKKMLLMLLLFGVVATLLAPSVLAAPKTDAKSSAKQMTLFDPFEMRTVMLADGSRASAPEEWSFTRQSIRVPMRAALRSAFKPVW